MLLASAQVVHHRTGRIARAGAIPDQRDQREFLLMGQEKIEAAAESSQAIALRMLKMNQEIGSLLFRQWMVGAGRLLGVGINHASMRSIAESSALQTETARNAVKNSAALNTQIMRSLASVAQHGLRPVHGRATANARRLSKLKKNH